MYDHNMNFWEIPSYLDAFLFEKENIICVYNNLVFTVFICFSFCCFSFHVVVFCRMIAYSVFSNHLILFHKTDHKHK